MSTSVAQYQLSQRLAQLSPSATAVMNGRVAQLRAEGANIISFSIGEPDFDTPEPIKAAGIQAITDNQTHYTPTGGIAALRKAVAERASRDNGIDYTINQVTTTAGAKEALFIAFQALCDDGDEVIIPAPYWVSYVEQARLAGAVPVVPQTDETTRFKLTPEQLAAHLSPKTRVVLLNSPSNPTGAVYTADELRALADVLRDHDTLVFTDEIYDAICYVDYARWLRVAPEFAERTLVFNGAAKAYAMTGWRVGYVAGPEPILKGIKAIQSHASTHTSSIAQYAALVAYTPSAEIEQSVADMAAQFHHRRDVMLDLLREIPGVECAVPDGAFYVFPNITKLLNRPLADGSVCTTCFEFANYLLDNARIATIPGSAFGSEGYLRLSYATAEAEIVEGMQRFAEAVRPA